MMVAFVSGFSQSEIGHGLFFIALCEGIHRFGHNLALETEMNDGTI